MRLLAMFNILGVVFMLGFCVSSLDLPFTVHSYQQPFNTDFMLNVHCSQTSIHFGHILILYPILCLDSLSARLVFGMQYAFG